MAYPNEFNGSSFEIGMILGELRQENRRQTEIMLAMLDEQRQLPDRLAAIIPPSLARTQPSAGQPAPASTVSQWTDLLKVFALVLLIGGVIVGKVTMPDALPLLRHAVGLK